MTRPKEPNRFQNICDVQAVPHSFLQLLRFLTNFSIQLILELAPLGAYLFFIFFDWGLFEGGGLYEGGGGLIKLLLTLR